MSLSPTHLTASSLRSPSSPFEAALESGGAAVLQQRLRSTPRSYIEGEATPRPRVGALWQEVEELECPMASTSQVFLCCLPSLIGTFMLR